MQEIYIKVCNGLANRLRTICSFYCFSKKLSANLKICWQAGPGWSEESFYDLFDLPILNFVSYEEYQDASSKFENLDEIVTKNESAKNYNYKWKTKEIIDLILEKSFCYKGDSCLSYFFPQYFKDDFSFLKLLIPSKNILQKINNISKEFDENTIGVHIRRGDAITCQFKENYLSSSTDSFEKRMNQELIKNKKAKFFLATDCPETERFFKSKFPIITNKEKKFVKSNYFSPKDNQKDAVIDMFLLSKTKKIIGTNWSSFSDMSAEINQTPLFIVKEEKIKNYFYENCLLLKISEEKNLFEAVDLLGDFYFECIELKKQPLIKWKGKVFNYFFENFYIEDFNFFIFEEKIPINFNSAQEFSYKKNLCKTDFFKKIKPFRKK